MRVRRSADSGSRDRPSYPSGERVTTATAAEAALGGRRDPNVLISVVASAAAALIAILAVDSWRSVSSRPWGFLAFFVLTIVLQLVQVEVYNRGATSFASAGLLAVGFVFGVGAAMALAVLLGALVLVVRRGRLNRAVFDAAQFSLAAGAGATVFHAVGAGDWGPAAQLAPAFAGGVMYMVVNVSLLTAAMSIAEGRPPLDIWSERFRWLTPYYLAAGPLALVARVAYEKVGITGLLAFALPPAVMMLSVRQYVTRTRNSVEEVREANEELQRANAELAERNDDLQALFQFAGGLAARAHDRAALTGYAEEALERLVGTPATIAFDETRHRDRPRLGRQAHRRRPPRRPVRLEASAGAGSATRSCRSSRPRSRAPALVDEVRKTHLETIAALSRSMEAKDYYTGGHTERVADIAVALAQRLGYAGDELDAIEIGALLHDIGKIGIPERILHKPGPLDDEEWKVMKEHPVISEYILSEVDLHPIVLQIARSSHERIDGTGYPDGLRGRRDPAAGADRARRRRVRRADERPPVPRGRHRRARRSTSSARTPARSSARR